MYKNLPRGRDLRSQCRTAAGNVLSTGEIIAETRKLEEITFDEMLELASLGAQVLHNRSVELAKKYQVNLEVLSSFERKRHESQGGCKEHGKKTQISGVATDKNVAHAWPLVGVEDRP